MMWISLELPVGPLLGLPGDGRWYFEFELGIEQLCPIQLAY